MNLDTKVFEELRVQDKMYHPNVVISYRFPSSNSAWHVNPHLAWDVLCYRPFFVDPYLQCSDQGSGNLTLPNRPCKWTISRNPNW